jgi:hypothetical protein
MSEKSARAKAIDIDVGLPYCEAGKIMPFLGKERAWVGLGQQQCQLGRWNAWLRLWLRLGLGRECDFNSIRLDTAQP